MLRTESFSGRRTLTIPIEGMSCASCVARIEQGLGAMHAVARASVNLATEQATVEFLPNLTDLGVSREPSEASATCRGRGPNPLSPPRRPPPPKRTTSGRPNALFRNGFGLPLH